jgi:hypothetical protein
MADHQKVWEPAGHNRSGKYRERNYAEFVNVFIGTTGLFEMQSDCARTVHESNAFNPFGLALSEKQIPRFVGNVSS